MIHRTSERIPSLRKGYPAFLTKEHKSEISKDKWNEAITGSHEKTLCERNKIVGNTMTVESEIVKIRGFVHPWKGNIQLCWLKDSTPCLFAPRDNVCVLTSNGWRNVNPYFGSAPCWLNMTSSVTKKSQSEMKVHFLEKKWRGERRDANSYSRSPPLRCWGDQPLADVRYQHCLKHRCTI